MSASLSLVVLTYGEGGEHEPLVESLLDEHGVAPASLLVVHNPSRPGEPDPRVPSGCDYVRAPHNLGYAGGMNLGVERQRERGAELVLLLTHDARLRPGALDALVEAAEREPRYGILGPTLVLRDGDAPFSFGGVVRRNGTVAHIERRPFAAAGAIVPCDWVDGGTMLVRPAMLDRVGGFDERFWGYCEELDLCLRAVRAGYRVGVVADATAEQSPGGTKRRGAWAYLLTRNGIEYARRAAGARGVAAATAQALSTIAVSLLRVGVRGLRLRPGDPVEPWQLLAGTTCGLVDFARRRWGPPPPRLPGLGDLHNVHGRRERTAGS
ncbi:MAG: glycosyltransferase family 2 protein [Thermoleophilaceae bacterium]